MPAAVRTPPESPAPQDSVARFSARVGDYSKHRPAYPAEILGFLARETGLPEASTVADVGAGTGIFTRLLLAQGYHVLAVEPNDGMRETADRQSAGDPRYTGIRGTAEATSLPAQSVAAIFCAQAFHWCDPARCAVEWRRILQSGGWAVLLWNTIDERPPFDRDYQAAIRRAGPDAQRIFDAMADPQRRATLFGQRTPRSVVFANHQVLDFDGLAGRTRSVSYVPAPGRPGHEEMMAVVKTIFDRHAVDGRITLHYQTEVVFGRLA